MRAGLQLLASVKRRRDLERAFDALLAEELEGRIQAFDTAAANAAGEIAPQRQAAGRPVEIRDVRIAGIAKARRAQLATRNTRHFTDLEIELIDPGLADRRARRCRTSASSARLSAMARRLTPHGDRELVAVGGPLGSVAPCTAAVSSHSAAEHFALSLIREYCDLQAIPPS